MVPELHVPCQATPGGPVAPFRPAGTAATRRTGCTGRTGGACWSCGTGRAASSDLRQQAPERRAGVRLLTCARLDADVARPVICDRVVQCVRDSARPGSLPVQPSWSGCAGNSLGTASSRCSYGSGRTSRTGGADRASWSGRASGSHLCQQAPERGARVRLLACARLNADIARTVIRNSIAYDVTGGSAPGSLPVDPGEAGCAGEALCARGPCCAGRAGGSQRLPPGQVVPGGQWRLVIRRQLKESRMKDSCRALRCFPPGY